MTPRRWLGVAVTLVAVLLVGRVAAGLYVDYRWYASLGAGALAVWRARLADVLGMRIALTAAASAFYFANLYGVSGSVESLVLPRRLGDLEIGERVAGHRLLWAAAAIAVLLGIVASLLVDDWMSFDLVRMARPFGVPEPYTGADLGFFVYWLPLENALYVWALIVLLTAAAIALVLYALTSGVRWESGRLRTTRHVRRHLTLLAAAVLLLLAWGHRLDAYALLSDGSGAHGLFSYVDYAIILRTRFALAILTALAALVVVIAGWRGEPRLTFWMVTAVFLGTLLLRGLVPVLGARLIERREAERRDVPFRNNRAYLTQAAYALNGIVPLPPTYGAPTPAALASAVPLWDPIALGRAVERERRGEIAADEFSWQAVGGRLAAFVVTRPTPEPGGARDGELLPWRAIAYAATTADVDGNAIALDPSVTGASSRPRRLLVSPDATGYAVTNDSAGRLVADPITGFWSRLAHAWDQRDFRLLLSNEIDRVDAPAIVLRRGVRERVDAVVPFFAQSHAVTPLVARDTLYWVTHLYAASESFPLSRQYQIPSRAWSYFQHAAVAIVNAESGRVTVLADAAPGHLGREWIARFPTLFTARSEVPPPVLAALPPATDAMLVQAAALTEYGSRRDVVTDSVQLPMGDGADLPTSFGPRALALLPDPSTGAPTPAWTMPLVDSTDHVAGVLVAFGGSQPVTAWMPATPNGARWREVVERLQGASPQLLAGSPAGDVERGRVRTWPVAGRLAFGQVSFLMRPEEGPTVRGLAALVGDSVRTGRSWADVLGIGATGAPAAPGTTAGPATGNGRMRALYDAMRGALRRGDWTAFGAAFDSLGAILARTPR